MTTTIAQVHNYMDQNIRIQGWLYSKRSSGKIHFLQIRDGSGSIQCVVVRSEVPPEVFAVSEVLSQESAVIVEGLVRRDTRSSLGYELSVQNLIHVSTAPDYPITHKEHGIDFLLDHRHLWIRTPRQRAILKIRAEVLRAMSDYLDGNGFTRVDPPILTPTAAEGTTELFHIQYFDQEAYLTQSGQMYMEAAAMAMGKVYSMGPTFRAERSKTRRHLIEFWMIEPEMAYFTHEDNLKLQESFLSAVVQQVLNHCQPELELLGRDLTRLRAVQPPFPRMSYDDAVVWLQNQGHEIQWGEDFGAPDESELANQFDRPVFIERYPTKVKAFYMQPDPKRPEVALCADLLAPEGYGEIVGGSERIHDYTLMKERFIEHKLPNEDYAWYLDLRKYGSVPHSGFGIGLERTVAWICGLEHVREAAAFPRLLYRLYP
ncbi:asparagine--tRNA ligase [Alicyclobacillaceae bacterium I2511]|nr:asparagine--tRNA ligase [Alicyclobacillaceae bacterium I2511]